MYKIKCECTSVAHLTINYFQMGLCMVYLSLVKYDVHETPRYLNFLGKKCCVTLYYNDDNDVRYFKD